MRVQSQIASWAALLASAAADNDFSQYARTDVSHGHGNGCHKKEQKASKLILCRRARSMEATHSQVSSDRSVLSSSARICTLARTHTPDTSRRVTLPASLCFTRAEQVARRSMVLLLRCPSSARLRTR